MDGFFVRTLTGNGSTAATFAVPFEPDILYIVLENGQTCDNCVLWIIYNKATELPYKGFLTLKPNNAAVLSATNYTAPVYDAQNKTLTVESQTTSITNRPFFGGATYKVFGFAVPTPPSRGGLRDLQKSAGKADAAKELPFEDSIKEEMR